MTLTVSVVSTARTLPRPAQNARAKWSERESCIITLQSDEGARGQGEAAPLPGFSPDSLQACQHALAALDLTGIAARLAPGQDLIGELGRASSRIPPHLPAARTALEGALLDLWGHAAGAPAWALLLKKTSSAPASRCVAALLDGDPEQALAQALAARARGITTFKFKIGRPGAFSRELAAVQGLRAELGPSVRLRLDANQTLNLGQAKQYLPLLLACDLEFIEEPCAPQELSELRELGMPCAIDESLATGARPQAGDPAVILKPTLVGGVSACFDLARTAHQVGAQVVVSHAFEGPIGLALSAALALSIGSETLAHGLDLESTRLEPPSLPGFAEAKIVAWLEPGFGIAERP